ncbi:hypothetical protein [Bdellovibrio bacteriovorus]|uniref:hypothetical protein n=1 Tax=Bdellovibrio bacteriovorus TaxID=959 RepID=UPI000A661DC1|nr:hypothetical protein [Bdellovibrio bacteriovorus]
MSEAPAYWFGAFSFFVAGLGFGRGFAWEGICGYLLSGGTPSGLIAAALRAVRASMRRQRPFFSKSPQIPSHAKLLEFPIHRLKGNSFERVF